MNISLGELRSPDDHRFLLHTGKSNVLAHVTKRASGDQVLWVIVSVIVVAVMDFLILGRAKATTSANVTVSLEDFDTNLLEFRIGRLRVLVIHAPVLGLDAEK
jgi:hypothetical protein